jgi:hypothetical protein
MSEDSNVQLSNSVISLDGLAKPATRLIEKLSDGIGALYRPRQIKNLAEAEVEAAKIKARGAIEITEIERRGLARLLEQEGRHQSNFENVVRLALPEIQEGATPDEMDDDWLTRFFEESKVISDEEMQSLWGKILANEANKPGTFSKRTLRFVSDLNKNDAALFTALMGFGWILEDELHPIVMGYTNVIYRDRGIKYDSLKHLDDIGVLKFSGSNDQFALHDFPKPLAISYFGVQLQLHFEHETRNELSVGTVLLTRIGSELAPICGAQAIEGFLEYCLEHWQKQGCRPASPFPHKE